MAYAFRRSYRGTVKGVVLDWAGTAVDYGSRAPVMAMAKVFDGRGVPVTIEEARGAMGLHKMDHIRSITRMPSVAQRWKAQHGTPPN